MSTEIFLVRHGRTEANDSGIVQGQSEVPLNALGIRQAQVLAGRLQGETFSAVYSSDLSRAMMTARIVAPNNEIIPVRELREWDLGHWVGMDICDVKKQFPEEYECFSYDRGDVRIKGGETRGEVNARVSAFLENVVRRHNGGRVLVVSHCGTLRAMFKYILGVTGTFPRQPEIGNVSLSRFLYDDGLWQLGCWNDTSHLKSLTTLPDGY